MNTKHFLTILTSLILLSVACSATQPDNNPTEKPDPDVSQIVFITKSSTGQLKVERIEYSTIDEKEKIIKELSERPDVLSISNDAKAKALACCDDTEYQAQWGHKRMLGNQEPWNLGNAAGIVIAVIDTGVATHPDLGNVQQGKDFINPDELGTDPAGHGTHVAGIIAAEANNEQGIAGIAPEATILSVRVLDENGEGLHSDIADGIIWAVDNKADIINLSLGSDETTDVLKNAVNYALDKGVLVVAASGNDGAFVNSRLYPAVYPGVLTVGATNILDGRALFSNYGSYVDLVAPGMGIMSTVPGGYAYQSGTSMAAPFVTGAAALTMKNQGSSAEQTIQILKNTASDLGAQGKDDEYGFGMPDISAARGGPVTEYTPGSFGSLPNPELGELPSIGEGRFPDLEDFPKFEPIMLPDRPTLDDTELRDLLNKKQNGISVRTTNRTVPYNTNVTIQGVIEATDHTAQSYAGKTITLQVNEGQSWKNLSKEMIKADGSFEFKIKPLKSQSYQILYAENETDQATKSARIQITVDRFISIQTKKENDIFIVTATVLPSDSTTVTHLQKLDQGWTSEQQEKMSDGHTIVFEETSKNLNLWRVLVEKSDEFEEKKSKSFSIRS